MRLLLAITALSALSAPAFAELGSSGINGSGTNIYSVTNPGAATGGFGGGINGITAANTSPNLAVAGIGGFYQAQPSSFAGQAAQSPQNVPFVTYTASGIRSDQQRAFDSRAAGAANFSRPNTTAPQITVSSGAGGSFGYGGVETSPSTTMPVSYGVGPTGYFGVTAPNHNTSVSGGSLGRAAVSSATDGRGNPLSLGSNRATGAFSDQPVPVFAPIVPSPRAAYGAGGIETSQTFVYQGASTAQRDYRALNQGAAAGRVLGANDSAQPLTIYPSAVNGNGGTVTVIGNTIVAGDGRGVNGIGRGGVETAAIGQYPIGFGHGGIQGASTFDPGFGSSVAYDPQAYGSGSTFSSQALGPRRVPPTTYVLPSQSFGR